MTFVLILKTYFSLLYPLSPFDTIHLLTQKTFVVFLRTLFHTKPELSDELLERTGVDPTLRPNQVNFEDYEKICRSFLEVSREHDMPITPLRVRKPVAVATRKLTGVDIHTSYQITQ